MPQASFSHTLESGMAGIVYGCSSLGASQLNLVTSCGTEQKAVVQIVPDLGGGLRSPRQPNATGFFLSYTREWNGRNRVWLSFPGCFPAQLRREAAVLYSRGFVAGSRQGYQAPPLVYHRQELAHSRDSSEHRGWKDEPLSHPR